ncbi:hypothetical protein [Kitasatospora sp. NE20-6]
MKSPCLPGLLGFLIGAAAVVVLRRVATAVAAAAVARASANSPSRTGG